MDEWSFRAPDFGARNLQLLLQRRSADPSLLGMTILRSAADYANVQFYSKLGKLRSIAPGR